ncbi:MAG TPA: pyrroloquinoline quinone-dependent dehydrogenase [Steroidobacteraceae bacterium]
MAYRLKLPQRLTVIAVILGFGYAGWSWYAQPRMRPYDSSTSHTPPADTAWPQYGNTPGGLRYSELDQVNRSNVEKLRLAWSYQSGELRDVQSGKEPSSAWEATPILAGGALIGCSPVGRVFALNPATGKPIWTFDPHIKLSKQGREFVKCRGLSSFDDAAKEPGAICRTRVIYGTADLRVIALDAATGKVCPDFGVDGEVRLDPGGPLQFPDEVQIQSPPAMVGDVAVFGSTVADMVRVNAPSGMIRAIDARSGKLLWTFDPVPRGASDPAAVTWGKGSARYVGAGNAWSMLSADPANDLVFVPTTSPSVDTYGGYRPGDNRYTDSLVALHAHSGQIAWHFQFVHHDLWDYDLPAQPILVELMHDGKSVPAVVQLTKQGMIFVFNRLTGKPLFPIEERPVPQTGAVPGEWLAPTQPYSTLPALVQQGMTPQDAWGFTFLDKLSCRRRIERLRNGGMYTPPSVQGTINMPGAAGGANWGGGAIVPASGTLIVDTSHVPSVTRLVPRDEWNPNDNGSASSTRYYAQTGTPYAVNLSFLVSRLGAPCSKPPWGRLTAVDLVHGRIKWQVSLGSIGRYVPAIHLPLNMGTPHAGGPIVTKGGLAFIAATMDDKFRAFDIDTGDVLWQTKLPAGGQSTPMTYAVGGRQYVVLVAGGHPDYGTPPGDYVLAYALKP